MIAQFIKWIIPLQSNNFWLESSYSRMFASVLLLSRAACRENTELFNNVWTLSLCAVCHTLMLKTHRGTFSLYYCIPLWLCVPLLPVSTRLFYYLLFSFTNDFLLLAAFFSWNILKQILNISWTYHKEIGVYGGKRALVWNITLKADGRGKGQSYTFIRKSQSLSHKKLMSNNEPCEWTNSHAIWDLQADLAKIKLDTKVQTTCLGVYWENTYTVHISFWHHTHQAVWDEEETDMEKY